MDKFCNTFDIEDFEKLSNDTKEKCKHLSKYIIKNSKGNIPLATIISNYYNKIPLENYNNILDPCSVNALYNKEKNMYVVVFGEYHNSNLRRQHNNGNQVQIATYIEQLVSTQPYFFDIFLEATYRKDMWFITNSQAINDIQRKMERCFVPIARKTSFPNARCHLADFRKYLPYNTLINKIAEQNIILDEDLKALLLSNNPYAAAAALNKQTLDKFDFELFKSIQKILVKNEGKVLKQYNKLLSKELRKQIKQHILLYSWENYFKKKIYADVISSKITIHQHKVLAINNLRSTLIRAPLLDYYTLMRMFRTFDNKNSYTPNTMNNIIIYSGFQHSGLYCYVLDKLGFVSTYSNNNCKKKETCVSIKDFKFRQI